MHDEWFADEEKVRTSVGLLEKPVLPHSNELEVSNLSLLFYFLFFLLVLLNFY